MPMTAPNQSAINRSPSSLILQQQQQHQSGEQSSTKCDCKDCLDGAVAAAAAAAAMAAANQHYGLMNGYEKSSASVQKYPNTSEMREQPPSQSPSSHHPHHPHPQHSHPHPQHQHHLNVPNSYDNKSGGYCDCPSCQHQLALIKSSRNNSIMKPKVTPNRLIISPNSSFSPVVRI